MIKWRSVAVIAALSVATTISLGGCGGGAKDTSPSTQQGVDDVMQQQMQQEQGEQQVDQPSTSAEPFVGDSTPAFEQVDFDLTEMNSEMVYATVFDMMSNPEQYEGKVVKMEGPYCHSYYEATQMNYFYVIIKDATVCCAQGLEFVWGDGVRAWPNEYPADGVEVVVTGRFETYEEESMTYVHLVDASLQAA